MNLIKTFFKHVIYGIIVINTILAIQGYIMAFTIEKPSLTEDYVKEILTFENYNEMKIGKEFSIGDRNFGFVITFNPSNYGLFNRNCNQDANNSDIPD